jgi:hypothetical protein
VKVCARLTFAVCVALLAGCGGHAASSRPRAANASTTVGCSMRSEADFERPFADGRNLVLGPLVLVGAGEVTSEATMNNGQKFPLLVRAGHAVTVQLDSQGRRTAGLAYGPLPQGRVRLRDTYDRIRFVACRDELTFWSGGVISTTSSCVPLAVFVDDERSPRQAVIPVGPRPCAAH